MLSGFKKNAARIYIYLRATLEFRYILLFRLADITRTAPLQTSTGCGPGQTATTRRQSLWLHRAPGDGEMLTFSLGYRF